MQNMQTGEQIAYGNYDANEKVLRFEPVKSPVIYKMIGDVVAIKFYPAANFLLSTVETLIFAKVGSVSADKDGVYVKLTTEGITKGAYARNEVRNLFDKVKSGEYYVGIIRALADERSYFAQVFNERSSSISPILEPIEVELEVEGSKLKMKPAMKRCLTYDAKEKRVGSVASEKVLAEIGKKLAEEEDQVNTKIIVKMKDETEFRMDVNWLEKDDDMWSAKVSGGKKALDYVQSANNGKAALVVPLWVICDNGENGACRLW